MQETKESIRAEVAPASAPNATWLARTKLHLCARSVREKDAMVRLSLVFLVAP